MELNSKDKVVPVKLFSVTSVPENYDETLSPIIFIPGFFSTNRTFTNVKCKISKSTKRKIYVIELRNHGKSEYSAHFTLNHVLADFEKFMEDENIPRAVLAGHSMGGRLALAMALKHPDKVEKLIVEDISVVTTKSAKDEFIKSMMFIKFLNLKVRQLPDNISQIKAQRILFPHVAKFFPMVVENFSKANSAFCLPLCKDPSGKFTWEFNIDVILSVQKHFDWFDIDLSSNPVYTGETLLLTGDKSITGVQHDLEELRKYFPKLECKIIENGFHTYHIEFPELYFKFVSQFINEDKI